MALAALLTRSLTQYRAGRCPLPAPARRNAEQKQAPNGACDRVRGTAPAARPAALAALARAYGPRGSAPAIGSADAALFAARMVNDTPHRPAASALLDHAADTVVARIHFEDRP